MSVSISKISKSEGGDPLTSATTCLTAGLGAASMRPDFRAWVASSPASPARHFPLIREDATTGVAEGHFAQ